VSYLCAKAYHFYEVVQFSHSTHLDSFIYVSFISKFYKYFSYCSFGSRLVPVVVKFDPHNMMTRVLATRSFRHSGAIPETALLLEDASITGAPTLSVIPEPPILGNSAQHKTTTATDHP